MSKLIQIVVILAALTVIVHAQTTAFTYQGKLTDGAAAANGTYQMQFVLFDAASGGTQTGATVTNNSVAVASGTFTVTLDFGSSPFTSGADRWLEVSVRKATDPPGFTLLTPRQQITSSPYSLKTLSATSADGLSTACVGCVTDAKVANGISYAKLSGAPTALPPSGVAAGDLTGTYPNPVIGNGVVTSAKLLDGTITNADINIAAGIATTKISGLGSLATVTPTGTGNATNFLRGDNSWQPAGGGPGNIFFNSVNMSASTPSFSPVGAGSNSTVYGVVAMTMPAPCTLSNLYLSVTPTNNAAADTVTVTLFKNGSSAGIVGSVTASATLNTTTSSSNTSSTAAFGAGDTIAFQIVQTNTAPTIRLNTSIQCQ